MQLRSILAVLLLALGLHSFSTCSTASAQLFRGRFCRPSYDHRCGPVFSPNRWIVPSNPCYGPARCCPPLTQSFCPPCYPSQAMPCPLQTHGCVPYPIIIFTDPPECKTCEAVFKDDFFQVTSECATQNCYCKVPEIEGGNPNEVSIPYDCQDPTLIPPTGEKFYVGFDNGPLGKPRRRAVFTVLPNSSGGYDDTEFKYRVYDRKPLGTKVASSRTCSAGILIH